MEYDNEEYNWQPFLDVDAPFPNQVSPFATSMESTIQTLFQMIEVKDDDVVLDIGSGDGRIVFYATETLKIKAIGIVMKSNGRVAREEGLQGRTAFMVHNFLDPAFHWSFVPADLNWPSADNEVVYPTILTMYLLPEAIELLYPKLEEYCELMHKQNKKARIISIFFKLERWGEWLHSTSEKNNIFLYIK